MAQQTAVEWLIEQVNHQSWGNFIIDIPKDVIERAKQMEKEQIMTAYQKGTLDGYEPNYGNGEQYYNEIFNK